MTGFRAKAALPLVLTYWLVLLLGLGLYTAARNDSPGVLGVLWGGCLFGTLVGHTMGLADIRLWFTAIIVGALVLLGAAGPSSPDTKLFWMTFAPATISAALSVSDRWSLAAFWFPAMIWMLTVLDGTHSKTSPEGTAAVLLGALAIAFVIFLRTRESRRVALWRNVSTAPLAAAVDGIVSKERPGKEIGRAGWMLATSAIVFAFTTWLAPYLWEVETFAGDPQTLAAHGGPAGAGERMPCCEELAEAERTRVKEYFDFGRGRDALSGHREQPDCRRCSGEDPGGGEGSRAWRDGKLIPLWWCSDYEIEVGICVPAEWGTYGYNNGGGGDGGGGGGGGGGGYGNGYGNGGNGGYAGGYGNGHGTGGLGNDSWSNTPNTYEPPRPYIPPTPTIPEPTPEIRIDPTPTPEVKIDPPIINEPTPTPAPPAPPIDIPNVKPEPTPAPTPEPHPAPAPSADPAPGKSAAPSPAANRTQKPASSNSTGNLLGWLSAFVAAVIALQILRYVFRPLRRAIAIRHLRKPFWKETVDQRVSNYWQLVLVGLRDAGWRTSADEAPRDFARRVGIDGVDKCASILDRTRHGIRIDADDLDEMARSADAAYHSARGNAGTLARAAAQIRWPLA